MGQVGGMARVSTADQMLPSQITHTQISQMCNYLAATPH